MEFNQPNNQIENKFNFNQTKLINSNFNRPTSINQNFNLVRFDSVGIWSQLKLKNNKILSIVNEVRIGRNIVKEHIFFYNFL